MTYKIILGRPKLLLDFKCKKCNSYDAGAVKEYEVVCSNCKTKQRVEVQINLYASVAKSIIRGLNEDNELMILGYRQDSKVFHPNDIMKPRSRHEDEIYHTLLAVHADFVKLGNFEVSQVTSEYDLEYQVSCNDCGYCLDCVTCTQCQKKYKPKVVKVKNTTEKRFVCECGCRSYTKTKVSKFGLKIDKRICPHCNSENIVHTTFDSDIKQCPRCHGLNVTKPKKIPVYKLVINRLERHKLKE